MKKILLILLLVVVLLGGFAFRTFLFDPFEGGYEADVSTLVPRDVDFFVAKAELSRDFSDFPRLAVAERVQETRVWRTFEAFELPGLDERYGITQALEALDELKAQLRGIDLVEVFGGEDVALAGYFRGADMAQADWAVYGRVNWMGKAGTSLLRFPGLIGLEDQGIEAVVEEDLVTLSGGQLLRPLFVTRVRDVGVVGTSRELVAQALELDARQGVDSLGQGATYFDHIENAARGVRRDEVELYLDWRAYSEKAQLGGRWPDPDSQDYLPRFLSRLFQLGSVRNLSGVVGFDEGVTLDLHAELSSELMTTVQKQIYRRRGVERDWFMQNVARMARADSALLVYVQIDVGDLLREMLAAADSDTRGLLEDLVRSTGTYNGVDALIAELGELFRDRVALIVRENTYVAEADAEVQTGEERAAGIPDAPHNDEPVPAFAVMLWTDGSKEALAKIESLHQLVNRNQGRFQIRGLDGASGVYKNQIETGHDVWEFWSELIDGTGHIATAVDYDRYLITNHYRMIVDLMRVFGQGGSRFPRLSDRREFRALMDEGLAQANAVVWLDPRALAKINAPYHALEAGFLARDQIDFAAQRAAEEARIVREEFPGQARGSLDPETQARVNELVEPRLQAMIQERIPALRAELERRDLYLATTSGVLAMLALDQKFLDLRVQALVPLDN